MKFAFSMLKLALSRTRDTVSEKKFALSATFAELVIWSSQRSITHFAVSVSRDTVSSANLAVSESRDGVSGTGYGVSVWK